MASEGTEAAREATAWTRAVYEERLQQIERGAAQLLAGVKAQEKALRREFGRTTLACVLPCPSGLNGFSGEKQRR